MADEQDVVAAPQEKLSVLGGDGALDCATFVVRNEDHTLGNPIRCLLMRDKSVEFAGYSIPHPSEPSMNVRVQTLKGVPATEALRNSIDNLEAICDHVMDVFNAAVEKAPQAMQE